MANRKASKYITVTQGKQSFEYNQATGKKRASSGKMTSLLTNVGVAGVVMAGGAWMVKDTISDYSVADKPVTLQVVSEKGNNTNISLSAKDVRFGDKGVVAFVDISKYRKNLEGVASDLAMADKLLGGVAFAPMAERRHLLSNRDMAMGDFMVDHFAKSDKPISAGEPAMKISYATIISKSEEAASKNAEVSYNAGLNVQINAGDLRAYLNATKGR